MFFTILKSPLLIAVLAQLLFSIGDLIARANIKHTGFHAAAFLTWWFAIYFTIRQFAMFGQLYVFSAVDLGRTTALFAVIAILLSNLLGLLLLGELLSIGAYLGVTLALLAFACLALF